MEEKTTTESSVPYTVMGIEVINTTSELQEFNIFGFDRHAHIKDFGIPKGLLIKNLNGDDAYATMLYATARKEILIKRWRLIGSESNITKDFTCIYHEIDGRQFTTPIKFSEYKSEINGFYLDKIIEVKKEFNLLSSSYFKGTIDANSKMQIYLYFDDTSNILELIQKQNETNI